MNRRKPSILALAVISEGLLVLLAYATAWITKTPIVWNLSWGVLLVGALCAVPLLVGNHLLWMWTQRHPGSIYARFSREVVRPLCTMVSTKEAFYIGVLSGIGEEVFFRGALSSLIEHHAGSAAALVVSSFLFAYVHFIGNIRRFGRMIPLYTGVGAILWGIYQLTESLAAAATTHATYNFLAITLMKYLDAGKAPPKSSTRDELDDLRGSHETRPLAGPSEH